MIICECSKHLENCVSTKNHAKFEQILFFYSGTYKIRNLHKGTDFKHYSRKLSKNIRRGGQNLTFFPSWSLLHSGEK